MCLFLYVFSIITHSRFLLAISDDHFCPACAYSSSSDDQLIAQLEFYFSQGRFSNISIEFYRLSSNILNRKKDNLIQDHYLRSQMDDEVSNKGSEYRTP